MAKSSFGTATRAVPVVRGSPARPLSATAAGMPAAEAADLVLRMAVRRSDRGIGVARLWRAVAGDLRVDRTGWSASLDPGRPGIQPAVGERLVGRQFGQEDLRHVAP